MALPGIVSTNSGASAFIYDNLQAAVVGTVAGNTNGTPGPLPVALAMEPQSAAQMTGRNPGGVSYRAPVGSTFASSSNTNAVACLIGGDIGLAAARMGYTKGGAWLITSNTNGTQAITCDLTNTQANTNSYAGDITFTTVNVLLMQNLCGIEGVSSNNGIWYVNASVTNGAVLQLNTNGSFALSGNGGTFGLFFPNGIAVAAATCKILCTPTNGGVLAMAAWGS